MTALAGIGVAAAAIAATATSASADGGVSILRSWPHGSCVDSNGTGGAYAQGCNGGNYQNWQLADDEKYPGGSVSRAFIPTPASTSSTAQWGAYQIVDQQTGRCLDSNENGDVYTNFCDQNNDYQAWDEFVWDRDGQVHTFVNYKTGRALVVTDDGQLRTIPFDHHEANMDFRRSF